MFHLVRILNSCIGVPEPVRISLNNETNAESGDLVQVFGGNAVRITSAANVSPTHYILAKKSPTEILAAPLSHDMIFETTVKDPPESMNVGEEYLLTEDGEAIGMYAAASGKRGAIIYDKLGATKAGDPILVFFR